MIRKRCQLIPAINPAHKKLSGDKKIELVFFGKKTLIVQFLNMEVV